MPSLVKLPLAAIALGAAGIGYGMWEAKQYRLRQVEIPMLAAGDEPLRILHISDLHVTPTQLDKIEWVRQLADLEPHLVVNTGDNLAHLDAVPTALNAFAPLLQFPGVFVMGSNDYYAPIMKNPLRYFWPQSTLKVLGAPLPWQGLRDGFLSAGWTDLDNQRGMVKVGDRTVEFVGTDDAHLGFDRYDEVSGVISTDADLSIAVTHAPYLRVIDRMNADGFPLIFAGHTHGGQLCIPGVGALVTNCDLPRSQAKGLHTHGDSWLHVSAGLGTSPYAPVRFACPPEATLVTLVPSA